MADNEADPARTTSSDQQNQAGPSRYLPSPVADPTGSSEQPEATQLAINSTVSGPAADKPTIQGIRQVHIDCASIPEGMSKNAAKKLAKRQQYEATKLERRAVERLKKKENKRARWLASQTGARSPELASAESRGEGSADESEPRLSAVGMGKRKSEDSQSGGESGEKRDRRGKRQPFAARLVVDCGFDELMSEKEVTSFTQQLVYSYSVNRQSSRPFSELILAGPGESSAKQYLTEDQHTLIPATHQPGQEAAVDSNSQPKEAKDPSSHLPSIYNSALGKAMNGKLRGVWKQWKNVTVYERGGIEALVSDSPVESGDPQALGRIPRSSVVYLTADTDETITQLEADTTYIIGGIVDKNRYKFLCKSKADQLGIRTARLPITQEHLDAVEARLRCKGETVAGGDAEEAGGHFRGRKVLTVNQVVEILCRWSETEDWVEALEKALPHRKYRPAPAQRSAAAH
ncbi:hypothetical protein BCV70DRAFT_201386 [Testicularia cyperi]|uniref:tRNA (guanine(9)-N1)-methyltransferase n=1 Tax=Testicularia cyperi TaxID=1882483 RepID=A0A317XMV5_9BASI|nr:hypothetical protein BCV70DRAFT_201386 [Testicularia cyperi]